MIEMLSAKEIESYLIFLKEQEKSKETIEKYKRELYDLLKFLSQKDLTKEVLILWKKVVNISNMPYLRHIGEKL